MSPILLNTGGICSVLGEQRRREVGIVAVVGDAGVLGVQKPLSVGGVDEGWGTAAVEKPVGEGGGHLKAGGENKWGTAHLSVLTKRGSLAGHDGLEGLSLDDTRRLFQREMSFYSRSHGTCH